MAFDHMIGRTTAKFTVAPNTRFNKPSGAEPSHCETRLTGLEMERQFRRLVTRSVFIRDKSLEERLAWCAEVFGKIEHYRYFESSTDIFSAAREGYEIFLAHGDDPVRLAKALRRNKAILSSKIKVALMAHSSPGDRALLLNAGFDLVADCRMHKAEYVARIVAIYTRSFKHGASVVGPLDGFRMALRKYFADAVKVDEMRDRELLLLARLAARLNHSVHSCELRKAPTGQVSELTGRSLCVAISKLRKKLAPEYTIVSDYMSGYVLKIRETGEPAATV